MAKCRNNLNFTFSALERPDGQNVDKMLSYIAEKRRQYYSEPKAVQDQCRERFAKIMAVNFVYQSNKAECVGTQTLDGTRELLDRYAAAQDDSALSNKADRESVNYWSALRESHYGPSEDLSSDWKEFRESGLLTVQVVCDLHAILLKGLQTKDGGQIRKKTAHRDGEVYTEYQGKVHVYPRPEVLEEMFYSIVDRHNIFMKGIKKQETLEETIVFKCAAWLLHEIVSLHPFYDGNGRICRLLANHVLSLITPFPVTIYHANSTDRNRDDYIQAIIQCRDNAKEGLGKLASMLIEGAYIGWKELFRYLESGGLIAGKQLASCPIVIEKSDKNDISIKVKRFCRSKGISEDQAEELLDDVLKAVKSVDTSGITNPGQYLQIELKHNDICVLIDIFP